jgi:3-phenylpropionate/trans-cinnamate dioxygenase ferredoxin subunit
MNWIKIFSNEILQETDFIRSVKAEGKKLCIIKSGTEWFATQMHCPHAGADLSQGWCRNGNLVCPYHRHEFNLKTGRGLPGQGNYIKTYPVEIRNDGIYIQLPERGFLKKLFRL